MAKIIKESAFGTFVPWVHCEDRQTRGSVTVYAKGITDAPAQIGRIIEVRGYILAGGVNATWFRWYTEDGEIPGQETIADIITSDEQVARSAAFAA